MFAMTRVGCAVSETTLVMDLRGCPLDNEETPFFVTDDRMMQPGVGVLDETDLEILTASGWPNIRIVTLAQAVEMMESKEQEKIQPPDHPAPPGTVALTPGQAAYWANEGAKTHQVFLEMVREMPKERAEEVRRLRVDERNTWRGVARKTALLWGRGWGSNQLAGMALCEAASAHFGENAHTGVWNPEVS